MLLQRGAQAVCSSKRYLLISCHLINSPAACLLPVSSNGSSSSSCSSSNSSNSLARRATHTSPSPRLPAARAAAAGAASAGGDEDNDEGDADGSDAGAIKPGKPLRVERLLANLGYGKRKECTGMIKRKQLVYADTGQPATVGEKALASQLLLDGEPLDPPPPLTLVLHKPVGYVVTSPEDEVVLDSKVYDLLPYRFGRRKPFLSAVGRLDKDTSGLLLMTDDGQLLHSIQSPAKGIWKRYTAKLAAPLTGKDADKAAQRFASGQLQLQGDRTPLLPAALHMLDDTTAEVSICEGRYHQIRRMFGSLGHSVVQLHRHTIGGFSLLDEPQLEVGSWRLATQADIDAVLAGPDSLEAVQQQRQQQGGMSGRQQHQQQQQEGASLPSQPTGQLGSRAAGSATDDSSSSSADSPPRQQSGSSPTGSSSSGDRDSGGGTVPEDHDELYSEDDLDHPGEAAAAARRFKASSKQARRRAVMARKVQALRMQQQQRDKAGRPEAAGQAQ